MDKLWEKIKAKDFNMCCNACGLIVDGSYTNSGAQCPNCDEGELTVTAKGRRQFTQVQEEAKAEEEQLCG